MKHTYRNKQQGVVLVIALIALVAISLAGVALMRTVDTSNVVSGNIGFNEAATQVADIGAEMAYAEIRANAYCQHDTNGILTPNSNSCTLNTTGCESQNNCPSHHYLKIASIDPVSKLPSPTGGLSWSAPTQVSLPGDTTASYSVKYVIERMCSTNTLPAAFASPDNCIAAPTYDSSSPPQVQAALGKLFYRITVQASGPRNTRALAQYFYGIKDTVN